MILANGKPKFKTSHIEPTWSYKIETIEHLKCHMANAMLVSFDMEAYRDAVSELGLAMLAVNEVNPNYCKRRSRFFDENNVQALTIDLRKKPDKGYEHKRHGQSIHVENELEAGAIIGKTLSEICDGKRSILVGYDMYTEFRWIAKRYPAMASYFTSWVDVQKLVAERCNEPQLGLTNALRALNINDNRRKTTRHSAANDAVSVLAVLAGLLCNQDVVLEGLHKPTISRYTKLPRLQNLGPHTKYPYSARIANKDHEPLPQRSLADLCKAYATFDLKAVGMNSCKKKPIRVWWFAFNTLRSLQDFIRVVDGSEVEGKALKIIWMSGIECEAEEEIDQGFPRQTRTNTKTK